MTDGREEVKALNYFSQVLLNFEYPLNNPKS